VCVTFVELSLYLTQLAFPELLHSSMLIHPCPMVSSQLSLTAVQAAGTLAVSSDSPIADHHRPFTREGSKASPALAVGPTLPGVGICAPFIAPHVPGKEGPR
jgi:hypothetical protein